MTGSSHTTLRYAGSAVVPRIDLDVVRDLPLFASANEIHAFLVNLPAGRLNTDGSVAEYGVNVAFNKVLRELNATAGPTALSYLQVVLCKTGSCPAPAGGGGVGADPDDGLILTDRASKFSTSLRLTGLRSAHVEWGDPIEVDVVKTGGPFRLSVLEEKTATIPLIGTRTWEDSARLYTASLPSDVFVRYSPKTQTINYEGSAVIAELDIQRVIAPLAGTNMHAQYIAGRATSAHVNVKSLPKKVDLVFAYGASGGIISVEALPTGAEIGRVDVQLLSDPSLMTKPAMQQSRLFCCGPKDGFLFWDLWDFEYGQPDPLPDADDPYAVVLAISNLKNARYSDSVYDAGSTHHEERRVELSRSVRTPIAVDIRRTDRYQGYIDTRDFVVIDDVRYPSMYVDALLTSPARSTGFILDTLTSNGNTWHDVRYYGSERTGEVSLATNVGPGYTLFELTSPALPAGSEIEPGLRACVAPSTMHCNTEYDWASAGNEELSIAIDVNEPVTVDVRLLNASADTKTFIDDLWMENGLGISKEVDTTRRNSTFVFADTRNGSASGDVEVWEYPDLDDSDLIVRIPPGFRAENRLVELTDGGQDYDRGSTVCPAGTFLEEDHGINLQGRFCRAVEIKQITPASVPRPGLSPGRHTITLSGHSFSPTAQVRIGTGSDVNFADDPKIRILAKRWYTLAWIELDIEVLPGAAVGPRDVQIVNPVDVKYNRFVCHCFGVT